MTTAETLEITATFGGREVPRSEILEWERRRAEAVFAKLGMGAPPRDLAARQGELAAKKLDLGHTEIERRLRRELALSERSARLMGALSRGRRRLLVVELRGSGASAEAVPAFYAAAMEQGDEAPLLAASPDHWILRRREDGVEQVIETTGGAPLASRILLNPEETEPVQTPADPAFPVQWVAVGRPRLDGPSSGALRHQFRDDPDGGFTARLTIEFPAVTPGRFVAGHAWHLAAEFSNGIEAASV